MTTITDLAAYEYHDTYHQHPADSELWLRLMMLADIEVGEPLASTLMIVRNTGAILTPSEKYGYRIEPVIGAEGWSSREEYDRESALVRKNGAAVIKILGRLVK